MLKKILIGILIIVMAISIFAYVTYKKVEAQFESFMISEVERKKAEMEKELEEQIGLNEAEKEPIEEATVEESSEEVIETEEYESTLEEETTIVENETKEVVKEETSAPPSETEVLKQEESNEPVETVEEVIEETTEEEPEGPYTEVEYKSDKAKALNLAMARLEISQVSRLLDISKDGFTPEEKTEAKEMFYNNFTPEEQEWILGVYERYYSQNSGES